MGREIITVSVPSDSRVLARINAWKADPNANLSAHICAAIDVNGDLVMRLEAMKNSFDELLRLLGTRQPKQLTKEEWEDYYEWRLTQ